MRILEVACQDLALGAAHGPDIGTLVRDLAHQATNLFLQFSVYYTT